MIRRLYIDGYKAFVNHTIEFDRLVFLAGGNGTGKSGHFEVVRAIQRLVLDGERIEDVFPASMFSQFTVKRRIVLELDWHSDIGPYRYRLVIVMGTGERPQIEAESLMLDGRAIYRFADRTMAYEDADKGEIGIRMADDRSALSLSAWDLNSAGILTGVAGFKAVLLSIQSVRLNPFGMSDQGQPSAQTLAEDGRNLAAWLTARTADFHTAKIFVKAWERSFEREIGFRALSIEQGGRFVFDISYGTLRQSASLSDLSEGQRCLLALGATLAWAKQVGRVLLLDEPDNFLSIREVQALISSLQDATDNPDTQIMVASHNPSLVRALGGLYGYRFYRDPNNGHVRYTDLAEESDGVSADLIVQFEEAA